MKKFAKFIMCLMICVFAFSMAGCGKNKDSFVYPNKSLTTYGNGGMAVRKGDYIYFVNGYKSAEDMKDKKAKYTHGALMVMKLDADGQVVADEDGIVKDEYYRSISNKLCGFEATDLRIYGDYLYFASPCLEDANVDGKQEWAKKRVVFYRVKLDNSGKAEKIYQTGVDNDKLQYTYFVDGNDVYIALYETSNSKLIRVKCADQSVKTINNVTSVVLPEVDTAYQNIFYTKYNEDEEVYEVYQYNIKNDNAQVFLTSQTELTVKYVDGDYLFATQKYSLGSNNYTHLLRSRISANAGFNLVAETSRYGEKLYAVMSGSMVIGVNGSVAEYYVGTASNPVAKVLFNEEQDINVIGVTETSIYYYVKQDSEYVIKSFCFTNAVNTQDEAVETIATLSSLNTTAFDLDETYLYYYDTVEATETSDLYLHRLRISNNNGEQAELIGWAKIEKQDEENN